MVSRVVVFRGLGGLLCGSLISLFTVTSLGEVNSERRGSDNSELSSYKRR